MSIFSQGECFIRVNTVQTTVACVVFKIRRNISIAHSPDAGSSGGWVFWQEKPTCFSTELQGSGAGMIFLGGGLFSGELLSLSCCCCWPAILTLCGGGEEPLKQGRPACPFLQPGDFLKSDEAAELLS